IPSISPVRTSQSLDSRPTSGLGMARLGHRWPLRPTPRVKPPAMFTLQHGRTLKDDGNGTVKTCYRSRLVLRPVFCADGGRTMKTFISALALTMLRSSTQLVAAATRQRRDAPKSRQSSEPSYKGYPLSQWYSTDGW